MIQQRDKLKRHFFLVAMIIAFLLIAAGQLLFFPFILYPHKITSDAGMIFLLKYASFLGIWIVTILYCRFAEKDIYKGFGSARKGGKKGNNLKNLFIGLGIGVAINAFCALAAYLHNDLVFSFSSFDILYLGLGLVAIFIQSGAEELVTRGYLYGAIESRYGVVLAFVINSVFFAFLHGANKGITIMAILQITLISIVFSFFVYRYDSLWMAMGMHTGWNYTQSLLLGLPNSGIVSAKALFHLDASSDSILYSASFGLEGGLTVDIILFVMIVCFLIAEKRKKGNNM